MLALTKNTHLSSISPLHPGIRTDSNNDNVYETPAQIYIPDLLFGKAVENEGEVSFFLQVCVCSQESR